MILSHYGMWRAVDDPAQLETKLGRFRSPIRSRAKRPVSAAWALFGFADLRARAPSPTVLRQLSPPHRARIPDRGTSPCAAPCGSALEMIRAFAVALEGAKIPLL